MSAAQSLVAIGNIESFANLTQITHDCEYVQVTIAPPYAAARTYARAIRQRSGQLNAWTYSAQMARHVEEAAALVSTPALIAWLIDSGFVLTQ